MSRLVLACSWLRLLLPVLLLAGPVGSWAQVPAFTQAVSFNPAARSGISYSNAIALDAAGNQYVTGQFTGTLVLGPTTLVSAGLDDMFVAKRSASTGEWLWAVRGGGNRYDYGYGLAVDAAGNALVTGQFQYTATFGTGATAVTLTSSGAGDMFLLKLDATTGAPIWAVRAGGAGISSSDDGRAVALDAAGNAIVTGSFQGTASFGSGPATISLTSAGISDLFVAKFDASTGAVAWAIRAGGSNYDNGYGVAVDATGKVLVTGNFRGQASFGTGPTATTLTSAGESDLFVAKFDAGTGMLDWVVRAGSSDFDSGVALAVDAAGNALVTGYFQGTASFGSGPTAIRITSAGSYDAFVAKFGATDGTVAWAVRAGSSGFDDFGSGVAVDAAGNALVTGYFGGTASFGSGPTAPRLTVVGALDIFVTKYAAATGATTWAVGAGGIDRDEGRAITLDAAGAIWLTGRFLDAASFGSLTVAGNHNTGFLAKMEPGALPTRTSEQAARETAMGLLAWPNPAVAGQPLHFALSAARPGQPLSICLRDAIGRVVARLTGTNGQPLALPALPAGLYMAEAKAADGSRASRRIILR